MTTDVLDQCVYKKASQSLEKVSIHQNKEIVHMKVSLSFPYVLSLSVITKQIHNSTLNSD